MNHVIPMRSRVLVKLHDGDIFASPNSKIIIPSKYRHPSFLATVYAVGPDQLDVRPGDVVLISNVAGIEVPIDGTEYIMLDHSEIMAVIDNETVIAEHDCNLHWMLISYVKHYQCVMCGVTKREDGTRELIDA